MGLGVVRILPPVRWLGLKLRAPLLLRGWWLGRGVLYGLWGRRRRGKWVVLVVIRRRRWQIMGRCLVREILWYWRLLVRLTGFPSFEFPEMVLGRL